MGRPDWFRVLAAQHGVISRTQALSAGLTVPAIRSRVRRGEWLAVHPGVYRSAQVPASASGHLHAAALWGGEGAVIGGAAAAWWWSLTTREPDLIELNVLRQLPARQPVRLIRRSMCREDQTIHRGLPVVTQTFAALFGAVQLGDEGRRIFDRALLRGLTDLAECERALERNQGRSGASTARRWLTQARDGTAAESERIFARLLKDAGIAGWRVNRVTPIGSRIYRPDFVWDEVRVVVEIDGWAFHSGPEVFSSDRLRGNRLELAGYRVLHFTWEQLTTTPDDVLATVLAMLENVCE